MRASATPTHWDEWLEGTAIGWRQAIADLVVYLRTGVPARRFVAAMHSPGMTMRDTDAGVEVAASRPATLADQAGLAAGDLLLRVGGVPVFAITDVWVLMREHGPGTELEIEYVRSDERRHGRAGWPPRPRDVGRLSPLARTDQRETERL